MKPNRLSPALTAYTLALAAGGGQAQTPADPGAEVGAFAQAVAQVAGQIAFGDEDTLAFAADGLGRERVTKGAPYCADAVHETVQWLADADGGAPNRIVRRQTSRLCRDGEGRTRQEVDRGGRPLVYLRDPVAQESWVLDPQKKTARRLAGGTSLAWRGELAIDHSVWREYAEQMRVWAREVSRAMRDSPRAPSPPVPPTPPTPPTPPVPAVAPTPPVPPAPVAIHRGDGEREVRVLRLPDGAAGGAWPTLPGVGALPLPPGVSWRAQVLAPRGPGVVSALPPREVEGLRVHGERTTWTIEAGQLGNEKPIQIVREVWSSPELLLTIATRDFDPRRGEVNYRLANLRRGEPDAALMRLPAGYSTSGRQGPAAPARPPASMNRG